MKAERRAHLGRQCLQAPGLAAALLAPGAVEVDKDLRGDVAGCVDGAGASGVERRQHDVFAAGEDGEFAIRDGVAIGDDAFQEPAGILDAGQVGRLRGHRGERFGRQFHAAVERKIVGQHRHPHGAADVHQVVREFLLGGPDVVRGDDRDRVDADGLRLQRERDRVARADAAHVGDHGHAPGDRLLAEAQRDGPFLHVHRAEFAGGPAHEQSVDPGGDQRVDQHLPRGAVDPLVLAERCHQGGNHSVKETSGHGFIVPGAPTRGEGVKNAKTQFPAACHIMNTMTSPGSTPELTRSSDERVLDQLNRILASKAFRQADRLKRFLSFVVEETVAGRSDRLKEFAVGVEVFGKDTSFDPRNDPIVRVQARRLRAQLTRYYREEGQEEALVIEMPKGGYTPIFRLQKSAAPKRPITPTAVGRNTIRVLPFSDHSPESNQKYFCDGLREEIIHTLAGTEAVRAVGVGSGRRCRGPGRAQCRRDCQRQCPAFRRRGPNRYQPDRYIQRMHSLVELVRSEVGQHLCPPGGSGARRRRSTDDGVRCWADRQGAETSHRKPGGLQPLSAGPLSPQSAHGRGPAQGGGVLR